MANALYGKILRLMVFNMTDFMFVLQKGAWASSEKAVR